MLQQRINILRGDTHEYGDSVHFLSQDQFVVNDQSIERLRKFITEKKIRLVIIDSLIRVHSQDENDARGIASVFGFMRRITQGDVAILVTHHNRKQGVTNFGAGQEMRGSSDILAAVDCHIAVAREHDSNSIIVSQSKLRQQEELKPFRLRLVKDGTRLIFVDEGQIAAKQSNQHRVAEGVCEALSKANEPMSKKQLQQILKSEGVPCAPGTLGGVLEKMVTEGRISTARGMKNATLFALVEENIINTDNPADQK